MKKWYDEEYEFNIEVIGFCGATIRKDIAATGKRQGIHIRVPMAVLLIKTVLGSVPKR